MHHVKAIIIKQNGKQSIGKGFSQTEIEKAGLNKQQAKQMGIRLDAKRKSLHEENVTALKEHTEKAKIANQTKPKAAKTEQSKKKAKS